MLLLQNPFGRKITMKSQTIRMCAAVYVLIGMLVSQASADDSTRTERESRVANQQIDTQQWHLSINTGAGVITNPLHGGDNLPLIVLPEIAFYGEKWFFDNGRLGYSFQESDTHVVNFVTEFNPETRFFIDFHPSNVFALQTSNSFIVESTTSNELAEKSVSTNDIKKRRWALDAGLSYHYIHNNHVISLQALADVTGVYKGLRSALQWQSHHRIGNLSVTPSLGVWYKSARLNDYFYGLSAKESSYGEIDVGSSWQPYAKIDARWPLSEANSLRFHLAYYDYSAVDDSPLFEHTYSMTAFIGFNHIF